METRGLTRRFGERVAVDGLDLSVRPREIFGCLGPNGSGKTTLMRMLLGLLEPSAGVARVLGCELPKEAERLRPVVGYMTQRFSLYEDLTVRENLSFASEIFGLSAGERRERVEGSLSEFGLERYAHSRAAELSGGWKQRVALAAATIHRPRLLVLDEPTAGLDPQSRREFWERLFELTHEGATIFVSTHYMDEAMRCHRLCMLRDGRRVAVGTPAELCEPLAQRVVNVRVPEPEQAIVDLTDEPLVASTTQLGDTLHVLLAAVAPPAAEAAVIIDRVLRQRGHERVRAVASEPNLEDAFVALLIAEAPEAAE
ncbi:MAG: ABC transporter ATP-binding protein [Deltaproteobacteria bacterium]|nr:ABC transporter ATP-binding protein [Deltaproteobacteria bacterium]